MPEGGCGLFQVDALYHNSLHVYNGGNVVSLIRIQSGVECAPRPLIIWLFFMSHSTSLRGKVHVIPVPIRRITVAVWGCFHGAGFDIGILLC